MAKGLTEYDRIPFGSSCQSFQPILAKHVRSLGGIKKNLARNVSGAFEAKDIKPVSYQPTLLKMPLYTSYWFAREQILMVLNNKDMSLSTLMPSFVNIPRNIFSSDFSSDASTKCKGQTTDFS